MKLNYFQKCLFDSKLKTQNNPIQRTDAELRLEINYLNIVLKLKS